MSMEPHSDNPYRPNPPRKLFFFCEALPPDGWRSGGSPIVDTRALYRAIDPAIREKFERLGVQYMYHNADRNHDDRLVSWQSSFKTDDRAAAERVCKREGYNFEWTTDGGLVRWVVSPPCRPHHQTGEMCWCDPTTCASFAPPTCLSWLSLTRCVLSTQVQPNHSDACVVLPLPSYIPRALRRPGT